ncbi:NTP transferase domain-containing protein [Cryptosporangium phraense]|uniref:Phosphocholine cytidylyltransferase family protein n=1 Tax=Cryptosporangium phraense TaxID=2593070 RepID=A0A545AYD7_9ACTN|nr:phosphocholine cytidylyltransferase family protein [Cryptosporangium phraense]TQS46339.1 phosphocholine cytidylyltransferase family protein [Cryptosporangium phraense]
MAPQVVILAAGLGTRLGRPHPKTLTPLRDGKSILRHQLDRIDAAFGGQARVTIVVGFKMDLIMEAAPDVKYVYNEVYDQTNTCKSLLKALRLSSPGGVLWLNGDVVFVDGLLEAVAAEVEKKESFICVNTESVADEEVKYTLDGDGYVKDLSKQVREGALGEAVGINYVSADDKATLVTHLESCDDQDYFERGVETAIADAGSRYRAVDISRFGVVEVDFDADLARANELEVETR